MRGGSRIAAVLSLAGLVAGSAWGQIITTVAGTGGTGYSGDGGPAVLAQTYGPVGVVTDAVGNLYFCSYYKNWVRKVDASGIITAVAGTGVAGYSGDGGPATLAQLNHPWGLAIDPSGNLYIGDTDNHRVRKVDPAGTITTVAGTGTAGYSGDGGPGPVAKLYRPNAVALDAAGRLLIADGYNCRVRRLDAGGTITTIAGTGACGYSGDGGPATSARLSNLSALLVDSAGNLYIGDQYTNQRVRKVDGAGVITTVAGNGSQGHSGDGGPATSAMVNNPSGLAIDRAGNLYIACQGTNRVRKIDVAGVITTVVGTGAPGFSGDGGLATSAMLRAPTGLAMAAGAQLFIADQDNHRVRQVTLYANRPPTAQAGVDQRVAVGMMVQLDGTGSSDPDGDLLTYHWAAPAAITLSDPTAARPTYTATLPGIYLFVLSVSDGRGGTSTSTVQVTVDAVNVPPSFAGGPDQTIDEDAGPQTVARWATAISAGPASEAAQLLSFIVTSDHPALFVAQPAVDPAGTLTYTPAPDANGWTTVTVTARDDGGTANGGVDTSVPQTFVLTVVPVNDPPVLAEILPQSVEEGQFLTFPVTASDPDGPVALSLHEAPVGTSLVDHHDGTATFSWTPGYDQAGTVAVTFTASDGSLSDNRTVLIAVVNVTRTIAASAGAGGTITPSGETTVDHGASQAFTITPDAGYHIVDVLVDGEPVGASNRYVFSRVEADHTITATFALNTFTLTAIASSGGTITPVGTTPVIYGSSQTFAIAPDGGYAIAEVLVDGGAVGAVDTYTFSNVTTDHTITAAFVDTTPPVITLNGSDPLLLELGTIYPEPGAMALDQADGDLTDQIQVSGTVDVSTEGRYTVTYTTTDAAGNTGSASRTVQVVVTPNSYGLIATHSLDLRGSARIHSGFVGVIERGERPFLAGRTELVVGTRVQTAPEVRLSAPRVRVRDHASIGGSLVYTELTSVGRRTTIGQRQQVPASYFPLFQGHGLPAFQSGTPGTRDFEVRQRGTATLSAGAFDEVRVKERGTLTFSGGTYQVGDLEIGQQAKVVFLGPTVLLVKGQLSLGERSSFAPTPGVAASAIRIYVESRNGRLRLNRDDRDGNDDEDDEEGRPVRQSPRAAQVGQEASFQGSLYAPNGTVDLRQGSTLVGSVIARDLIVGVRVQVAAQSGWNTPGVIYQPGAPAPLAKVAATEGQAEALVRPTGTSLRPNYPNPYNPSTTIPYSVAETGIVKLTLYNTLGQQVRVLVDRLQAPGSYQVDWDGLDAAGLQVAGGVYLVRLEAGSQIQVSKMLLAK